MQLNVMVWLPIAWALCLFGLLRGAGVMAWGLAIMVSAIPFFYNVHSWQGLRGFDSRNQAEVAALERHLDINRTVFFYQGWENVVAWQFLLWTPRWDGVCDLPPAPTSIPKFKWISVVSGPINHPNWTAEQHAMALKEELECAFDKGYTVVATQIWKNTAEELSGDLLALKAGDHGPDLYALFNDKHFSASPVRDLPGYYRIERY